MTDLKYRKALESDIDYLLWLRKKTMDEHLLSSGISLSDEEHLLRIHYLFDEAQVIMLEDEVIGLLKVEEKEINLEIVQIQIDPKCQGKGLGQKVIKKVIEDSKQRNKIVSLSVLKKNKARDLYLRMGFRIIGEDDHSFMMSLDHKTCT